MLDTIDEIVEDLVSNLHPTKRYEIMRMVERDLITLHSTFGKVIRNDYGFWNTHPLTYEWRTNPFSRNIIDGVDCSDYHPDALSTQIMHLVWKRLHDTMA
jgi:hypothetical protein